MQKSLWGETELSRGIPEEMLAIIDEIDSATDEAPYKSILSSSEFGLFVGSMKTPKAAPESSTNVLLEDMMLSGLLKKTGKKRSNKR